MTDTIASGSNESRNHDFGFKQYFFASLLALAIILLFAVGKDLINLILSSESTIVTALAFAGIILALVMIMHYRTGKITDKQGQKKN